MFASADMFDDEEVDSPRDTHGDLSSPTQEALVSSGSDGRRPHSSSISVSVSQMSRPSTTQQMSELRMGGDEKDDDNLNPVSPAARKAKMAELREQQLAKRKGKGATSGILQKNDAPKVDRPLSTSSVASPTSPANAAKSPTSASNPNILPVAPLPVSPTSSSAFSRTMSPRDGDAVVADSSSINAFLAERKAEKDQKQMSAVERDMLAHGITPVFDPVKKPPVGGGATANVKFDFSDMRNFLTTSAPKGITVQCSIVRQKKGLMNKMYPLYELYLDEGNRFLLAAKKRTKNKTSNYVMSMDKKNLTKESASYLGKVRSNFVGTEFVAYDKGINPKDVDDESASISLMTVRQELCGVFYESNILGSRGPRKMTALVPAVRKDGTRAIWRPLTATDSITAKYKEGQTNDIMCLQNKTPKWNDQVGAYVLNFNGRVTMASVKNFQLITADDPENVLLQFGRVGKDTFTMDFAYPISPLQAFAICLSSFDYKLACE